VGIVCLVSAVYFSVATPPFPAITWPGWLSRPGERAALLALAGVVILLDALLWHIRLRRAITPRAAPVRALLRYPSITVVRPVRGRDVGAADNFRAALSTGYPGEVQTLFIFDDETDPGLPVARQVVAEHVALGRPGSAEILVAGPPPAGRTGKLNAMMLGEHHASGVLVGFGDSDTRPDRHVLRGAVEALLTTPGAGSAFAPVLVHEPPQKAGDALYALMLNALYSPLAAYASGEQRELPFIMGQLMVFKREALQAIGGVACAEGQLVDDMYIGKRVHEAGYRNIMSRPPLHIETGGMSLRQFVPVCQRWMNFSRNGLPFSFTWRQWLLGVRCYLALALAVAALACHQPLAGVPAALAFFLVGWSQLALHHRYGGGRMPARLWWTGWGVFLLTPVIAALNWLRHDVTWRGRVYHVGAHAALADSEAMEPAAPAWCSNKAG
jgi:ceramide glucosyltransferase